MDSYDALIKQLALKAIELAGSKQNEIERYCWMALHEYRHGVMPSEYDIREIDENLYLEVLSYAKKQG